MKNKSPKKPPKAKKPQVSPIAYIEVDGKSFDLIDIEPSGGRVKTTSLTVEETCNRLESGAICRDSLLQRLENQWNNTKESYLILSILNERPIGTIIMTGKGMTENQLYEKQSLLDGLQRTTTLLKFTRDKFRLSKDLPPISCRFKGDDGEIISRSINISGLKFSQLPTLFQRRILDTKIDVNIYNGFTDDELDNIVFCVNNGTPFKPMQKLRTVIGSKLMKHIQPICDLTFWEKTPSITAKNDNILGCVIRTLMLYMGYCFRSLSVSEMTTFAKNYLADCEEHINAIKDVENLFIQFDNAIHRNIPDEDYSFLTPCTIPHFIMSMDKFNSFENVKQEDYVAFLNEFLKSGNSPNDNQMFLDNYYTFLEYCQSGSGGSMYSSDYVCRRRDILNDGLCDYFFTKIHSKKEAG